MATYAIGDVHGELGALNGLLRQVEPLLNADDTLVFLGDLIDRGPDSRGCLDRVVQVTAEAPCRVVTLLGNHEQWFLQTYRDRSRTSWFVGMEGVTTVQSYSPEVADLLCAEMAQHGVELLKGTASLSYERFFSPLPASHLALLEGAPSFLRTPDVVCVHGGAASGEPVEAQDAHGLVWGHGDFPSDYTGPDTLVYGHWNDGLVDEHGVSRPAVNPSEHAFGIDTIARGVLTCLRFPDRRVFQSS